AGVVPRSGDSSARKDLVDGIVGLRGQAALPGAWYLPYYADIGAGSSRLTWQAFGGIGYHFKWGDAVFGYRHLAYDFDSGRIASDMSLSGPHIGVAFKF